MSELRVVNELAIFIDWKSYQGDKKYLKLKLLEIADRGNPWSLYSCREIRALNSDFNPEEAILNLTFIIKFLNENNIPWKGYKLTFSYHGPGLDYSGVIFIEKEYCMLVKVSRDGEISRNCIPLVRTKL